MPDQEDLRGNGWRICGLHRRTSKTGALFAFLVFNVTHGFYFCSDKYHCLSPGQSSFLSHEMVATSSLHCRPVTGKGLFDPPTPPPPHQKHLPWKWPCVSHIDLISLEGLLIGQRGGWPGQLPEMNICDCTNADLGVAQIYLSCSAECA